MKIRAFLIACVLAAAAFIATGVANADTAATTTPIITSASGTPVDAGHSSVSVDVSYENIGGNNSYTVCWLTITPGRGGYSPPGNEIVAATGSWAGTLPIQPGATYSAELLMVLAGTACPATFDPTADFYYLSNTVSFSIAAPPAPAASFSTSTSGLDVTVTDTATAVYPATIASASFDYGDGATGQDAPGGTATHTYATSGTYTITETATDTNGETDTATVQVTVAVTLTPPTSAFTVSKNGLEVTFTDTSAATAPATVATTILDFGDGASGSITPEGTLTHTYATPGTYTVTETTTDTNGEAATSTQQLALDAPEASFTSTPTGLAVSFTDTSLAAGTATIRSVSFLFGDGEDATIAPGTTTSHVYLGAGTFNVVEIVTDSNGLTSQAAKTIKISAFGGTPALHEKLSPTLTRKVSLAATEPVAVYCVTSWGKAKPERAGGKRLGLSIVGSDQTNIANAVCGRLLHRAATGLDLLVMAHETMHALGVASEKGADCDGLSMLPRLEKKLGIHDRGQARWARSYVLAKWKACG